MTDHRSTLVRPWAGAALASALALAAVALLLAGVGRGQATASIAAPAAPSSDGQGIARLTVRQLNAGLTETFCLVYTATGSITTGGSIRVDDPDFHGTGWTMWNPSVQTTDPAADQYLTATTSSAGATVALTRTTVSNPQYKSYSTVWVSSGELTVGDVVSLCHVNWRTPHKAYAGVAWETFTDGDGDGSHAPLAVSPRLEIVPSPTATLLVATGPTYVEKGTPFTLTVRALDYYSNPCTDFDDTLTFTSTDPLAGLPMPATVFGPASRGVRQFSVTLNTMGIHYIAVDVGTADLDTNSNPFVVVESLAGQPQVYWGDLHGHHGHVYTDATFARVDQYMTYARDVADLDFACESHKSSSYYNTMETHVEVAASIDQYDDPGRFVAIRGYEWMGDGSTQGHHNIYYSTSGPVTETIYSPDDEQSDELDELWWLLEENLPGGTEALVMPHALLNTPCGSGTNWDGYDEFTLNRRYRPLVEIYSHWGSSEVDRPGDLCFSSARKALVYGNRVGFYGSSDTHFGYPGNPQEERWGKRGQDYVAGLAAVRALTLTREGLWEGLTARQTYATEGERMFLDFRVNGYRMGSEISSTVAPQIVVTAAGTAPISQVLVFKGHTLANHDTPGSIDNYFITLHEETPGALVTSFAVTDAGFDANAFYYVRVTQQDGRRAWASPVWVDYGEPVDLWVGCGDGVLDPGETLVSCPADAQVAQRTRLTTTTAGGAQQVLVSDATQPGDAGTALPMLGLYVYNVENVTGFVPYTSSAWLPFMEDHVDRVVSAGLSTLGFSGLGMGAYQGPAYPTLLTLTNPAYWDLDSYDRLFDYAAHKGVYLLPTSSEGKPLGWWKTDPITHRTEMMQIDSDGTRWSTASFDNPEHWQTADPILGQIIARYRDHPALLGWDVRVGEGENNYPPPYAQNVFNPPDAWCDYSVHARDNFRAWLADHYPNDAALQAAWGTTHTFATAEIPYPLAAITPTTRAEMILYANGSADTRAAFRDWVAFRLDEKEIETQHIAQLFQAEDPDHVIVNAASVPLAESSPRTGRQDGERAYRADVPDAFVYHPRIAHDDATQVFNVKRSMLYNSDRYAVQSGKLTTWANEETSEMSSIQDEDNIWRLATIDVMHAAMGQGDGWTTGNEGVYDPDHMMPTWDATERAEMRRLAPIHSAPGVQVPRPRVAVLADDFGDGFNYPLAGQLAAETNRVTDRATFLENLFGHGLSYDLITVDDVISFPGRLPAYDGVLMMNLPRLSLLAAAELDAYRDGGGGLFVAGVTGVMDAYGRPDTTTLQILLDVAVTGKITGEALIDEWQFTGVADSLVGPSLRSQVITDNLYYIPALAPGSGYTEIAHLTGTLTAPVAGYRDRTVFWFPRLAIGDDRQAAFQRNLWAFFGVPPDAVSAEGPVEATGGSYRSVHTPVTTTVDVALSDAISSTGALVWDWNGMRLVGSVPAGPSPQVTLAGQQNDTFFLGLTPRTGDVQLVALSGGLLGPMLDDAAGNRLAVGIYRALPGELVTVVVYPGDWRIEDAYVRGGTLIDAAYDPSGSVYLVTLSPYEERVTVTVVYGARVYLPLVVRGY